MDEFEEYALNWGKFYAGDALDADEHAVRVLARIESDGPEMWIAFEPDLDVSDVERGIKPWDLWVPIEKLELLIALGRRGQSK